MNNNKDFLKNLRDIVENFNPIQSVEAQSKEVMGFMGIRGHK